jgi:hypothetical protein
MAKIWFVQEGLPARGDPISEKPLAWCAASLSVKPYHWKSSLNSPLTVGQKTSLSEYSDPRFVVIRVEEHEATGDWKAGYYFSPSITIDRVKELLR